MTREQLKNVYLNGARASLHIALFAPVILSGAFFFPFIVPKTVFFQLAVECALFFYIMLVALEKRYRPSLDAVAKGILAFFAAYVLAAAFGANPARSFLGTYERMLSVVNLAHFVAFFFVAKAVFQRVKDWLWFFRVFLAAAALVALYAVGQKLNMEAFYHAGIDRLDGTIGNAAFLAAYMLFASFFAFVLLILERRPWVRVWYVTAAVLYLAVMYFTGTRGAALGFVVGALTFAAAFAFKPAHVVWEKKHLAWWLLGTAFAVVAAVGVFEWGHGGVLGSLQRFTSVSLTDATVQTRILSLSTSWDAFKERPVFGWGPENYNLAFDKYYNPKLYPTENWFDHAHNIFFDTLTSTGAVGFAAYFFFLGMLVWVIARGARAAPQEYLARMLFLALVVAYFAQNVFVFDSLATYLPLFMLCALAASGFPLLKQDESMQEEREKRFQNPSAAVAVWLLPVMVFAAYWVNARPAVASYAVVQAFRTNPNEAAAVKELFDRTFAYGNFGEHEIAGKLIEYVSNALADEVIRDPEERKELARYAAEKMEGAIARDPRNFRNYLSLASFLSSYGEVLEAAGIPALDRADELLAAAEPLAKDKPPLYLQWGSVKLQKKENAKAVEYFEKAVALNPDVVASRLRLGNAYRTVNMPEKAQDVYKDIFESGRELDARTWVDLALGFAHAGDRERAVASAERAARADPSLKAQAESFIRDMRALR